MRQQPADDRVSIDSVGFGFEVHQYAMAQDRQRDGGNVIGRGDDPSFEQRPCLRTQEQGLSGARTRAPADPRSCRDRTSSPRTESPEFHAQR